MRALILAAFVLFAAATGGAQAARFDDLKSWYGWVQSLIHPQGRGWMADRHSGVITPPEGIDPKMAVVPPENGARMPVIPPPGHRSEDSPRTQLR